MEAGIHLYSFKGNCDAVIPIGHLKIMEHKNEI